MANDNGAGDVLFFGLLSIYALSFLVTVYSVHRWLRLRLRRARQLARAIVIVSVANIGGYVGGFFLATSTAPADSFLVGILSAFMVLAHAVISAIAGFAMPVAHALRSGETTPPSQGYQEQPRPMYGNTAPRRAGDDADPQR